MIIKRSFPALFAVMTFLPSLSLYAGNEHQSQTFHKFTLETDYGIHEGSPVANWDFDGWIGGDYDKLWLKSEGEILDHTVEQAELWAMYSRNISDFWDLQMGVRQDIEPESTSYLVMGVTGLAQYFFETDAHIFLSDGGDISLRLKLENEFLLTQRLILTPYLEIDLFAQDVISQQKGAGLASTEIGLQTRYEISRKFAPYVDLHYQRKYSKTANLAQINGEDKSAFSLTLGLRVMF